MDIYQRIWNADQEGNGLKPVLDTANVSNLNGFVKVNSKLDVSTPDLRVLPEVLIPDHKKQTYNFCKKLFDNYSLSEKDEENDTDEEREEIHIFLSSIIDTPPMLVAREYVAQQTGTSVSKERWYNTLMEMWFRKFAQAGEPHLSGFEHVIVGEQDGSKAQGYHFWYKYFLDDGFAREVDGNHDGQFPGLDPDRIFYSATKQAKNQQHYPESVTISFKWMAADYDRKAIRPLTKPVGGFFVGCSVEGLMALGTIRAHEGINAPRKAVINGAEYDLSLYSSENKRHIRTFYPKFIRGVDGPGPNPPVPPVPPPVVSSSIRIVAALINPEGDDVGKETITLINVGSTPVQLSNWSFLDKNNKQYFFSIESLGAGETTRILLDGKSVQLSNSGGTIRLLNHKGEVVHLISYNETQARENGITQIF